MSGGRIVFERPARPWDDSSRGGRAQRLTIEIDGKMALEEWYSIGDSPSWLRTSEALPKWDAATGDREAALWSLIQDLAIGRTSSWWLSATARAVRRVTVWLGGSA